MTMTAVEKTMIVLYNLIEPFLVASIISISMQISQIGTIIYMLISMGCLTPLLLTEVPQRIEVKKWLSLAMIIVAPVMTLMKMWIYCQFTDTKNVNNLTDRPDLRTALGVFPNQWTKTFLNDLLVLVLTGLLFWHYIGLVE